jgi:hypothetical protein
MYTVFPDDYFFRFDVLVVNVKSQHIIASAGAVGSSTVNEHCKFLLCNFWLPLLMHYLLGGAAIQCGRI